MAGLQDMKPEPPSPTESPYYRRDSVGSGLAAPSTHNSNENLSSSSGHGTAFTLWKIMARDFKCQ